MRSRFPGLPLCVLALCLAAPRWGARGLQPTYRRSHRGHCGVSVL